MRHFTSVLFMLILCFTDSAFAQDSTHAIPVQYISATKAFTVGLLQGGGSLIGADVEFLVSDHIGLQAGAGLIGFGAGINYHFEPTAASSGISFAFWNQGTTGDQLSQQVAGATYLYRNETGGLTLQLGLGYVLTTGKLMSDYYRDKGITDPPKVILLYSLGWYFF